MSKHIFCRICWNKLNWTRPSGDAPKLENGGSYAATNGFGHEEWLFNFNWEDEDGYKYAFLQPINKQYNAYKNNDYIITLYSKSDDWYFVAQIANCHVLSPEEKKHAFTLHKNKGWLETMKEQLRFLNCKTQIFDSEQENIFNIRFKKEDVMFFDPFFIVPKDHKIRRFPRYQTFPGVYDFKSESAIPAKSIGYSTSLKSTEIRNRQAAPATQYDALHDKIQNSFYKYLCTKYGRNKVFYENNHVDVILRTEKENIYYDQKNYLSDVF